MNNITLPHSTGIVHLYTNMPHTQNVLQSLGEGDRPACEAVSERVLRFGTS